VFELREHHRKSAARGQPKIGQMFKCERCETEAPKRSRSGPHYCSECSLIVRSETITDFRERNRDELLRRERERRRTDPKYAVDKRMKWMIRRSLQGDKGGRRWRSFVDYSLDDLIRHIERQFLPGMSWKNMRLWHIDHIIPLSSFGYSSPDSLEFKAGWALSNLRPLWARDNVKKSAKRTHLL
jgi:ribosomal protein L37AE/L43A